VHRLNTFPMVHAGTIQMLLELGPLIPLLERFEAEHGTLVSAALFFGRKSRSMSVRPMVY